MIIDLRFLNKVGEPRLIEKTVNLLIKHPFPNATLQDEGGLSRGATCFHCRGKIPQKQPHAVSGSYRRYRQAITGAAGLLTRSRQAAPYEGNLSALRACARQDGQPGWISPFAPTASHSPAAL